MEPEESPATIMKLIRSKLYTKIISTSLKNVYQECNNHNLVKSVDKEIGINRLVQNGGIDDGIFNTIRNTIRQQL